jgi:dihydrolipoamide dehydrogenase
MQFDQIIIGSGTDAIDTAVTSARNGLRVALVADRSDRNVSADTLKLAADAVIRSGAVSMAALRREVKTLMHEQANLQSTAIDQFEITRFQGNVRLVDGETVSIQDGGHVERITAESIVIACGTKSMTRSLPNGSHHVIVPEDLLALPELPATAIVVGAGPTGLAQAIVLARLGVEVTVIDEHRNQFELCGGLMDTDLFEAQSLDIAFRLGDEVIGTESRIDGQAVVRLASGRMYRADTVLLCVGREGRTAGLNLESIGVGLDEKGRIWCDASGQTWVPSIRAIGDVVGFRSGHVLAN